MKGMSKKDAMANYIFLCNQVDPLVGKKINNKLCPENQQIIKESEKGSVSSGQGIGFKKVEQVDYSD